MNIQSVNSVNVYAQLSANKPENQQTQAKPAQDEQLAKIQQAAAQEEKRETPKSQQAEQENSAAGGAGRLDLYV